MESGKLTKFSYQNRGQVDAEYMKQSKFACQVIIAAAVFIMRV